MNYILMRHVVLCMSRPLSIEQIPQTHSYPSFVAVS